MSLWSAGEVRMTELLSTAHSMPRAMARYWSKGEVGRLDFDVVLAPRRRKETWERVNGKWERRERWYRLVEDAPRSQVWELAPPPGPGSMPVGSQHRNLVWRDRETRDLEGGSVFVALAAPRASAAVVTPIPNGSPTSAFMVRSFRRTGHG
jgi:hypothetical protein